MKPIRLQLSTDAYGYGQFVSVLRELGARRIEIVADTDTWEVEDIHALRNRIRRVDENFCISYANSYNYGRGLPLPVGSLIRSYVVMYKNQAIREWRRARYEWLRYTHRLAVIGYDYLREEGVDIQPNQIPETVAMFVSKRFLYGTPVSFRFGYSKLLLDLIESAWESGRAHARTHNP